MKPIHFISQALLVLLIVPSVIAQGTAFNYQGRLRDRTDIVSGLYDLRFALYDAMTNGRLVAGPITTNAVEVQSGLFSITLDFGPEVFTGASRWMEISVRTNGNSIFTTLTPRQPLLSTPYAITAGNLSGSLSASQLAGALPSAALVGRYPAALDFSNESNRFAGDASAVTFDGFGYCNLPCYWSLKGNAGTTADQNFIGTTDNSPLELRVNNQRALRLQPTTNNDVVTLIGGSRANFVHPDAIGATIAGGGSPPGPNFIEASYSSVGGGIGNSVRAGADFSTISGGLNNRIDREAIIATIAGGTDNTIGERAYDAAIGGGIRNTIESGCLQATIGGGGLNTINSPAAWTTISGGWDNAIEANAEAATIAGGVGNIIKDNARSAFLGGGMQNAIETGAQYATVAAGWRNTVEASLGVIGGGSQNRLGSNAYAAVIAGGTSNTNAGNTSVIGGGFGNLVENNANGATIAGGSDNTIQAIAHASVIGGGSANTNRGPFATVPGGAQNLAAGQSSLAAGNRAKAVHDGAFVWADSSSANFTSAAADEFSVRAIGGTRIVTAINPTDGTPTSGVRLPSGGGSWSSLSDRNAKENVAPADSSEILQRLATLPVLTWNYKSQPPTVRHIGPMAQDFKAAFGLGEGDTTITTVDADGVALAAIQALTQKLKAKEKEIDELQRRLAALERRVDTFVH